MTGYELYCKYQAIKLHFTSESYDYFKYHGKTRTSEEGFEGRKDKHQWHRLARNVKDDEVVGFLVSNLMNNPRCWTMDLLTNDAKEKYRVWRKRYESLTYQFSQDFDKILSNISDPKDIFKIPEDGSFPVIWTMMNQSDISIETIIILNKITGVLKAWDTKFSSDYLYQKKSFLIKKYEPFLSLNLEALKKIIQIRLTKT